MSHLFRARVPALGLIVVASLAWSASATTSPSRHTNTGLLGVDCRSARGCTALGYHDADKQSVAIFAGAGRWDRRTTLLLPGNASRFGARFFAARSPNPDWVDQHFHAMSCPPETAPWSAVT